MTQSDLHDLKQAMAMLEAITAPVDAPNPAPLGKYCMIAEEYRVPVRAYLESWVMPSLARVIKKWEARLAKK